ncbi:MAG: hypothetical protein WKG03_18060, partial [Telluria sp.]
VARMLDFERFGNLVFVTNAIFRSIGNQRADTLSGTTAARECSVRRGSHLQWTARSRVQLIAVGPGCVKTRSGHVFRGRFTIADLAKTP